jgi:hypothetical protein
LILGFGGRSRAVFDPCRDFSGRLLASAFLAGGNFGGDAGELAPVNAPVRRLGDDHRLGLIPGNRCERRRVRYRKNLARFQAVDIAAIEGIGIGPEKSEQHLVKRDALRPQASRNRAQGFAALDLVGVTGLR